MNNDLEDFVNKLQNVIFEEAEQAYGEAGFQRWLNPKYNGRMKDSDAAACIKGNCGDTMEIFLKFSGDVVRSASYVTSGCASSSICGSFTAEMTIGKAPIDLTEITGEAVLKKIGKFPKKDEHCAYLAAETLQEALRCYLVGKKTNEKLP